MGCRRSKLRIRSLKMVACSRLNRGLRLETRVNIFCRCFILDCIDEIRCAGTDMQLSVYFPFAAPA